MTKPNNKYWKTGDLYLAAYCFARGAVIVGIEATERKAIFTFIDFLDRQQWNDKFHSNRAPIDAQTYVGALKTLKQKALDALIESYG